VPQLRIALAQVNATVGDLAGNTDLVLAWTRRAAEQGARVVVFPEMVLTGYPVEDLALRASFVDASVRAVHQLAARLAAESFIETAKPPASSDGFVIREPLESLVMLFWSCAFDAARLLAAMMADMFVSISSDMVIFLDAKRGVRAAVVPG